MNYVDNFNGISVLVDTIKMFFLICYTYFISLKILNKKIFNKKELSVIILFLILSVICKFIEEIYGYFYSIIYLVFLEGVIFSKVTKNNIGYSMLLTIISLSINYIIFFVSLVISFIPSLLLNIQFDFITLIIILFIYSILLYIFLSRKRFNKGISFLKDKIRDEYINIVILNTSVVIIFCIMVISNYKEFSTSNMIIGLIIFSIIMFITIQKSLQLYYKQKLQERETEEIKEELKDKNKEIEELQKENLKLNKINHSIAHKQKSLEYELNQLLGKVEVSDNLKNKVENLSKEMQKDTINVELTKTNINEIDNMLKYMQSECLKNKIDFELQINGNIHHMVNKYISKEDLEILLADHIKNAMIAIRHGDNINKSILVRLGIIDGLYSLYIYDSGIEFELETLINLGMKPSTTHKDDGGTGMGFMNTFDTLKKYNASIIIEEYGKPSKEKFTKVIKIIFDKENTYKISSYREEEIRKKDIEKRIEILK